MAWRYTFADLLTDRDLVDLELSGVTFDERIIEPGTFKATAAATNRQKAAQITKVVPGRTVCHIYRDADIWGSYLVWSSTPKIDNKGRVTFALSGAGLGSWLWHRFVAADRDFLGTDQITIGRTLLADVAAGYAPWQAAANIGLTYKAGTSGVPRDRSYRLSEMTSVGQRLSELANCDNGFEWRVRTWLDTATGTRPRLWDWAPMLGQVDAPWSFSQPGNVLSVDYPQSALESGTGHWARGDAPTSTAGSQPLIAGPYPATDLLAAGWPWLDVSTDHQGVSDQTTLTAYALRWRATHSGVIGIPVVTVRLPARGGFSPSNVGDSARLTLVNDLWPLDDERRPTFNQMWRVVGMEVTPGGGGTAGNDTAKLIFAEDAGAPLYPRDASDLLKDAGRGAAAAYTSSNTSA